MVLAPGEAQMGVGNGVPDPVPVTLTRRSPEFLSSLPCGQCRRPTPGPTHLQRPEGGQSPTPPHALPTTSEAQVGRLEKPTPGEGSSCSQGPSPKPLLFLKVLPEEPALEAEGAGTPRPLKPAGDTRNPSLFYDPSARRLQEVTGLSPGQPRPAQAPRSTPCHRRPQAPGGPWA